MNKEERQLKRKQETQKAMIVFIVFLFIAALLVVGVVFAITKFAGKEKPKTEKPQIQTEVSEETETSEEPEEPEEPVIDAMTQQAIDFVAGMTLEDKIAQMFIITPEALTYYTTVTARGDTTKEFYNKRPVGGMLYKAENLKDTEQTTTMLTNMKAIVQEKTGLLPFLSVDEEGGSVTRIAGNPAFGVTDVGDMAAIGATGDAQNAYNAGVTIGTYLKKLGFNMDFAPVADVLTNPENTAIGKRSFGADAASVAEMAESMRKGLETQGIYGVVKHFPGHGGTQTDSHDGAAVLEKTMEELTATELVPFQRAVDEKAPFIMVGHISLPNVTGDDVPASLSPKMINEVLRGEMGYNGIVITDAMNMAAVTGRYKADEATVMAVNAGADMILMPQDYETAYKGILDGVTGGTITETRLNEAVVRIVKLKLQMAAEN